MMRLSGPSAGYYNQPMIERRLSPRAWAIAFGAWTSLAVLSILQTALYLEQRGQPIAWPTLVAGRMLDWYTCFAFAPAYVWLIRRFPLDSGRRVRGALILLAATIAFVFIKYAALYALIGWIQPASRMMSLGSVLATNFFTEMLFLGGIALAVYALGLNERLQQEQIERVALGRDLAEARLAALSLQLQPHFLFNTMNGAVALIRHDPDAADDMLTDLSELLQDTLRDEGHEVSLARELEYLASYLRIMQRRFGDALSVSIDVDPAARQALVPKFLLQPIVENAIEHGLAGNRAGVSVTIRAAARGTHLRLEIADNGPGFAVDEPRATGVGLDNTRRRLQQLYGSEHRLDIGSNADAGTGTLVAIEIPFRTPESTA